MGVSKVDLNGETLVDLTGDTVTENNLLQGATAHNAAGEGVKGAVTVPTKVSQLENDERYVKSDQIATESMNGLMTSADKKKLDGIAEGANKTTLTTSFAVTQSGVSALDGTVGKVLYDKFGGCSFEQEGEEFYIVGADSVRKKLQGNNPIIISQKNIYAISNTPYVGACFVSGYNSLEFNYISATSSENVSILKIYGQNSDPFESQKGVLLKTITKGNTVYLDITDYDYIYWSGGEKGAFYATCKLTFS